MKTGGAAALEAGFGALIEGLALVANSVNIVDEGGVLKSVPDTRLWVIDLSANPPRLIDTVLSQEPRAGTMVDPGATVQLTVVSTGGGTITPTRRSFTC